MMMLMLNSQSDSVSDMALVFMAGAALLTLIIWLCKPDDPDSLA